MALITQYFEKRRTILSSLFLGCVASQGIAAPINEIPYDSITVGQLITFSDLEGGFAPGTNYDDLINFGGVMIGERFAGQDLSQSGNSDQLSGSPTGPLELVPGAPNENLAIFFDSSSGNEQVIAGLGPIGWPNFDAIGEGSVAILFDNDQSEFGFRSAGGDLGSAVFDFFTRDGDLIDTVMPQDLTFDFFGFARDGGVNDIAGISITNTDPAGIGFDDIIFDVPGNDFIAPLPSQIAPVPLPAGGILLLGGLGGLALFRRLAQSHV